MDNHLRFRGIVEEEEENIFGLVAENLANYLGEQVDDISFNFEAIYRVNSSYATQKHFPRDVVVQLLSKKIKEDIIAKSYKSPFEINGKTIKILKELPKKVIHHRKEYRSLTEKLKNFKIIYRWEFPEGLSFFL